MDTVIKVKNLSVEFKTESGTFTAVENINFDLKRKKTLAIVGESGSGKSVTSLAIMRLLAQNGRITNGQVFLGDKELISMPEKKMQEEILGKEISMIFQEPMTALNPILRVGDQIMEGLRAHTKMSKEKAYEISLEILKKVGISSPEKRIKQYPHQLSGGMRQRVMIAMALVLKPKVMIADEPTTALDVTIEAQILRLLDDLKKELDTSILFITHDLNVVADIADDVIVMYCGQVIEKGNVVDIFENTKHPYTKGLISAMPKLDSDGGELMTIPGNVPSINKRPSGCYFHTRCSDCMDICKTKAPEDTDINGHMVKCHLYNMKGDNSNA